MWEVLYMGAVQSVDYGVLYGKIIQNNLVPQNKVSSTTVKEKDSSNNIGLLTTQTDLENMFAGAAGETSTTVTPQTQSPPTGLGGLLGMVFKPQEKDLQAFNDARQRLAEKHGITMDGTMWPQHGTEYLNGIEEMSNRGELPKNFKHIKVNNEKEMYDQETGTLSMKNNWQKEPLRTQTAIKLDVQPPKLSEGMLARTGDLLQPSVLNKQNELKSKELVFEDPKHLLSADEKVQMMDKLLNLKGDGKISKGTTGVTLTGGEQAPLFSSNQEQKKSSPDAESKLITLAVQTDQEGKLRIDRMAEGIEKNSNPTKELLEARSKLKKETGIKFVDAKGFLTVNEEQKVITHIRDTFGKNGVTFPPDTTVEIVPNILLGTGEHEGMNNKVKITYRKDEKGDALLDPSPSLEDHGMLMTLTHELAHQDDDANRSIDGKERHKGGNESYIALLTDERFKESLRSTKGFEKAKEDNRPYNPEADKLTAKEAVLEITSNYPKDLKDNIALITRKMDKGELSSEQYVDEANVLVIKHKIYGRMADAKGNDLYNRSINQIEKGKESAGLDPSFESFRKKYDPNPGKFNKDINDEPFNVGYSSNETSSSSKYGEKNSGEHYAENMMEYVHDGSGFREQIFRYQNDAAAIKHKRDRLPENSPEWHALDKRAKYVDESADILLESYDFMKNRFNGKEF